MIVGLTGKYCAGKNFVAGVFEKNNFLHIDVDKLGHAALPGIKQDLVKYFGEEILAGDNIDRKKLGSIVFSDKKSKKVLEKLIHPPMVEMLKKEIEKNSSSDILLNAAILHRMGLDRLCDTVIWVDAPLLTRIKRAMKRDCLSFGKVLKRIRAQKSLSTNLIKKNSDTYIIRNSDSAEAAVSEVVKLIEKLKEGNI